MSVTVIKTTTFTNFSSCFRFVWSLSVCVRAPTAGAHDCAFLSSTSSVSVQYERIV